MKKSIQILITFIFVLSCDSGEGLLDELLSKNELSYIQSFNQWDDLKKDNGNSYVYKTTFISWTGYGHTTELRVENGIVVSRDFEEFRINFSTQQNEIIETYSESFDELGSHEKGATPRTIDELYNSCAKKYLKVNKKKNTIYFETEENGLMKSCGFVPNECIDDCYISVNISSFEWIDS